MTERHVATPGLYVLFFLSGTAALGYQLVWSKMFSTGLGHEMPAVLAVVCAIMVGMALGSFVVDRFVPRDARAGHWLAVLEFLIGIWAMFASLFVPQVNGFALRLIGLEPGALKHWLFAFLVPTLFLLPATAAMGATLPAMEKFLSAMTARQASIGSVYAANTFGAVAGTLLTPFYLMPRYGFRDSCWALAILNFAAAVGVLLITYRSRLAKMSGTNPVAADAKQGAEISSLRIAVTLFLTGLLGIGYEVTGVRVLTQVLEGTVFTYATVLAVFLIGTAAGAAVYHRWCRRVKADILLGRLFCGLGVTTLCGILALSCAKLVYKGARNLGDTPLDVFGAELLTAAVVFVPSTMLMGALFSHLIQEARERGGGIGGILALNTLGAGVAPWVCVVMLVPTIGTKFTLVVVATGYLALSIGMPQFKIGLIAVPFLCFAVMADLRIVDRPNGSRIIEYREGIMASVAVVEEQGGGRTLRVDNRYQMGGTAAADAQYRQAHLPLLLHPAPRRALFLGVGTGISFGAASLYPGLKADGVELVPEVIQVLPAFQPANFNPAIQPNLRLHVADARRYVRSSEEHYDVIVADVFHPYRDGAGALYTREHFAAIRARLSTNGLFCQWLPLHQLSSSDLQVITRTFLTAFTNTEAWLLHFNVDVPVMGLIGWTGGTHFSNNWVEARIQGTAVAEAARRLSISDSVRFFGHYLAGGNELSFFSKRAPVNTDDNQLITFSAPRALYKREEKTFASLVSLMDTSYRLSMDRSSVTLPEEPSVSEPANWMEAVLKFFRPRPDFSIDREPVPLLDLERRSLSDYPTMARKVSDYAFARDIYLRGLILDVEGRHDAAIGHYIASARYSPDFTSGYAQCLTIASAMASSKPEYARDILQRLIEVRPDIPVAKEMLKRLFEP